MKRKIFSIMFALVLVVSLSLVTAAPVAATVPTLESISAEPESVELNIGESQRLTVTGIYNAGRIADITTRASYESSDPSVATVITGEFITSVAFLSAGVITAVAEGSATITISHTEFGVTKTDTVSVTVSVISTDTFTFVIGLNSNPSTGYGWYADFSEQRVKLVDEWFVPSAASLGRVGCGGIHFFLFEMTSSYSAKVTFIYKRPWEDAILYKKTFYIR